jgi:REP element-mobilizing transposase RayT
MRLKSIQSKTGIYFLTSVIAKHKSIFLSNEIAMIPLNALDWFRSENLIKLYAFCLMPNHLHYIIRVLGSNSVEKIITSFHKFTGRRIIKYFEEDQDVESLIFFRNAAKNRSDREHLVWENSITKIIEAESVLIKLMTYVHNNPINKKWTLVEDRSDYRYSSACFYDNGFESVIPVDNIKELF